MQLFTDTPLALHRHWETLKECPCVERLSSVCPLPLFASLRTQLPTVDTDPGVDDALAMLIFMFRPDE